MAKITDTKEQVAAAKYFSLRNLALEQFLEPNLNLGWSKAQAVLEAETGETAEEEYRDWLKMVKRGDKYCTEEWQKVKENYNW